MKPEITYDQFNSIVDYRLYFLQHPNREELKGDILHFLGDRFQAISAIIDGRINAGDLLQLNAGVIFRHSEKTINVKGGSILLLIKKIKPFLWESAIYTQSEFFKSTKPKKTFIISESEILGLVQSYASNSKLSDPDFLKTISSF